jgi:threonyl-tRNA synthetase
MERFLACLTEHYGGAFPVWLSPVQAVIVPIADRHVDYAREVGDNFGNEGIRVRVDDRSERMNLKLREAQLEKVPYMLIVGDREVASSGASVRLRNGEDLGLETLLQVRSRIKKAIEAKA